MKKKKSYKNTNHDVVEKVVGVGLLEPETDEGYKIEEFHTVLA